MDYMNDILVGEYRFLYRCLARPTSDPPSWYVCQWLLGGVCVARVGKTWRAYMTQYPTEHSVVRDGKKPVRFRTSMGAARYLVEAITERKVKRLRASQ